MRLFKSKGLMRNDESGDTIVEVIIAVAIVSSVLAGAFAVTSTSSRNIRATEEHAEALQYLQGQVEFLRNAAARGAIPGTWEDTGFCLDSNGSYQSDNPSMATPVVAPQCKDGNIPYIVRIQRNPASSGATTTFDLEADWNALGGGNAHVNLSYRVQVGP